MDLLILLCVVFAIFGLVLLLGRLLLAKIFNLLSQNLTAKKVWVFLDSVPADPFTKMATRPGKIAALAQSARLENKFSLPKVLIYKEASLVLSTILLLILSKNSSVGEMMIITILFVFISWRWPELFLARRAALLKKQMEKNLSHVIDLLRLHVSAGQNLEGALRQAASGTSGVWGAELCRMVLSLDVGVPFDASLEAARTRINLSDFNRFVIALKQSRLLGVSLSGTLGIQANLLRIRRKQKAEEHARKASVNIAMPLVLCIFPALLIIYLAPAILKLMSGW